MLLPVLLILKQTYNNTKYKNKLPTAIFSYYGSEFFLDNLE